MPTYTDELELAVYAAGETYSAGTHSRDFEQIDESAGRWPRDLEENSVLAGCSLSIAAGTTVAISAGTCWWHGYRRTPGADVIGVADGLTPAIPGSYRVYYDGSDGVSPYYATTVGPNDPDYDIAVGTAVVRDGNVATVIDHWRLYKQSDIRTAATAGSADLLDGYHASAFARWAGAGTATGQWEFATAPRPYINAYVSLGDSAHHWTSIYLGTALQFRAGGAGQFDLGLIAQQNPTATITSDRSLILQLMYDANAQLTIGGTVGLNQSLTTLDLPTFQSVWCTATTGIYLVANAGPFISFRGTGDTYASTLQVGRSVGYTAHRFVRIWNSTNADTALYLGANSIYLNQSLLTSSAPQFDRIRLMQTTGYGAIRFAPLMGGADTYFALYDYSGGYSMARSLAVINEQDADCEVWLQGSPIKLDQDYSTVGDVRFNSLGIGAAAPAVAGALKVATDLRIPVSQPAGPISGSMYSAGTRLYLRDGGAWRYATLT